MSTPGNLLGRALLDHWRGETDNEIRVHCTLGDPVDVPLAWFFRTPDEMPEAELRALDLCQGRVIDLGAGVGSHALALQERGLEVTALDCLPEAVTVMEERGVRDTIQGNLETASLPGADSLLMLMNGIGAVRDMAGLDRFLAGLQDRLNPDGALIFDSTDLRLEFGDEVEDCGGQVHYTVEYKGELDEPFPWLFIHPELLAERVAAHGLCGGVAVQDEGGHFLAIVSLFS